MTTEVYESIQALVDYLYEDERNHWEENERPGAHIFGDVKRVADWLDEMRPTFGAPKTF